MKKSLSIITLIACMVSFGSFAFGEEATNNNSNLSKETSLLKSLKDRKQLKQSEKIPQHLKETFKFFKLADELKYTDDQIIKLRAYYKNHYSENTVKKEESSKQESSEPQDFYGMSEAELQKYAKNEAANKEKEIMSNLQKIIDLKKILTSEQLEMIKEPKKDKEVKKDKEEKKDKEVKKETESKKDKDSKKEKESKKDKK